MQHDFALPEDDEDHLGSTGLNWEAKKVGDTKWVIVRGFPIPAGYNVTTADAALRIPPSYPDVEIDMVYFFPALGLMSNRAISKLTPFDLEGKQYQQWSRHRTAANPWRPGIDNIGTHLVQVTSWLEREVK